MPIERAHGTVSVSVHRDDRKIGGVQAADAAGDGAADFLVRQLAFKRRRDVKNQVCVCRSRDKPEIVDGQRGVHLPDGSLDLRPHAVRLGIVGHDRVHMDGRFNAAFPPQPFFNGIDHVVRFEHVPPAVHLDMQRDDNVPRSVVVDLQVMHAERFRVLCQDAVDCRNGLQRGRTAEDCVLCVHQQPPACNQNQHRNEHAHERVDIEGKPGDPQRQENRHQHRAGGEGIGQRVGCGCAHDRRVNPLSDAPVQQRHPQLDQD